MKVVNVFMTLGLASLSIANPIMAAEEPIDDIVDEVVHRSIEDDKAPDDSALTKRMESNLGQTGRNFGDGPGIRLSNGVQNMVDNLKGSGSRNFYGHSAYGNGGQGYGDPGYGQGYGGPGYGQGYGQGYGGLGYDGPINMNPMAHPMVHPMAHPMAQQMESQPQAYPVQIPIAQPYNPFDYFGGLNQPQIAWKTEKRLGFTHVLVSYPWVGYAGPKFKNAEHVSYIVYKNSVSRKLRGKKAPRTKLSLNIVRYRNANGMPCIYIWNTIKNLTVKDECDIKYASNETSSAVMMEVIKKVSLENIKTAGFAAVVTAAFLPIIPILAGLGIVAVALN